MRTRTMRATAGLLGLALLATACGSDEDTAADTAESTTQSVAADSSEICDADGLVEAVQGGAQEGTLEGMADDPVATAASNNPVLTTLVTAVGAAGLGDTLNSAEALTVFAPTDCAFAALDAATLQAALDDPDGLLTTVLGFHVIAGERIAQADLSGSYETFTGETISVDGTSVDGQAEIVVGDIMTANATVHLIDTVLLPPSVTGAAMDEPMSSAEICEPDDIVEAVQGGAQEGTLEGMADDPVATAASNNPVLTTLVTAVGAAGLGDTLNSAEALTVFAPIDCAFADLDEATLQAALDDPEGLLTTVLGFHVVAGQRLSLDDLKSVGSVETFTGETLEITADDDTITLAGQGTVLVSEVMTANATVYLIDSVLLPPSITG